MFNHHDITRDAFMLHGPLAHHGYDWWWHSFTAQDAETGKDKPFFIEFFVCNPALAEDQPVLGQLPANQASGKRPSYLMVKAGTWGEDACQLHRFFSLKDIRIHGDAPYQVEAVDCLACETALRGSVAITICLFVAEDFRSGYAKNLFTVRAKKKDYVASKTIVGTIAGASMLLAFFLGAVLGGGIAGLPFTLSTAGMFGLIMCMLAKVLLMGVFVAIAVAVGCYGKQRSWLSILLFAFAGMLLFMMIPMMTPLDATILHVVLCGAGAAMFGFGLGTVSNMLLSKQDLV